MKSHSRSETCYRESPGPRSQLSLLVCFQAGLYATVAFLSRRFEYTTNFPQRPILLVLLLLAAGFALHLWSLRLALRIPDRASVSRRILTGAILFRLILLPSLPIQEVDIYRYLWDGAVVARGQNPYRFSPQQVLNASLQQGTAPELEPLVSLRRQLACCEDTLARIHYGELVTVYPPVSQTVFGLASWSIPDNSSLYQRVVTMKCVLTLVDLLTVVLLLGILRRVGHHAGWAILYAWSPLVLKEFANSGHLDSIAVCLTTGAVLCLLSGFNDARTTRKSSWFILSAILLGLGVGAKLYPAVLIPVLALWTVCNTGWKRGIAYAAIVLSIGTISLGPMLMTPPGILPPSQIDLPDSVSESREQVTAGSGLATFLTRWEINDFVFLITVENLRPDATNSPPTPPHWFVMIPNSTRTAIAESLSRTLARPVSEATFLTARGITLLIFVLIVTGLLVGASRRDEHQFWLRTVFLTVSWFWVLAPTLNPWYWTWALPFLPFAGRRAWMAVSFLVLAYYLRFWLLYQFPESEVLWTRYRGEQFFHFVVAPLEHGLWLTWLAMETLFSRIVPTLTDGQSPARLT